MATDFETAMVNVLNELEGTFSLKAEKMAALKAFIEKKDVFAVLPMGFGKSLIYQLAPLIDKKMGLSENPVAIVVSLLVALMEEQVREATKLGITAMQLGVHSEEEIRKDGSSLSQTSSQLISAACCTCLLVCLQWRCASLRHTFRLL